MCKPGLGPVAQPAQESIGEKRRRRQLGRPLVLELKCSDRVVEVISVMVQPMQPRQLPTTHVENRVEPWQHSLVCRQSRIVGVVDQSRIDSLVGVAEQGRLVSGAGGQRGRCCRIGCPAECRWRRPGCSSDMCPCRGRPARASTARPARNAGRAEHPGRPGRRAPGSAPRDDLRTRGSRPGTDRV